MTKEYSLLLGIMLSSKEFTENQKKSEVTLRRAAEVTKRSRDKSYVETETG